MHRGRKAQQVKLYAKTQVKSSAGILTPRPLYGRAVMAFGLTRFGTWSARLGYWDFVANAARTLAELVVRTCSDAVWPRHAVVCNFCGWAGRHFYRNTGPGYDEANSICPGCLASDRYRSLFELLRNKTSAFESGSRVVEVAPLRSLETIFRVSPGVDYTSFDIEQRAMERGDITNMRYETDSVDWFICFHVLEHLPDEATALDEIHRVLRAGGSAVFQVPVDWDAASTREYGAPDPRDVGHVRRHGRDFGQRIAEHGFAVDQITAGSYLSSRLIFQAGLSPEPIYVARAIK
jgi:SAM-dependent methyltransferase